MTEQIVSAWDAIVQFLTNKIASAVTAVGVGVSAEALKKTPSINLEDYVFLSISAPVWMQLMASFWIFTLIIEKYGFFRFVNWVWQMLQEQLKKLRGE